MEYVIILLLIVIIWLLLDIRSRLPARDYVQEALERDRKRREADQDLSAH